VGIAAFRQTPTKGSIEMPTITTADLKSVVERNEDILLVNTLPEDRFEDTKLPGAVNFPQDRDDFVDRVEAEAEGDKDKKIVVYCANIECDSSSQAAKKLEQASFTNVFEYRVGYKGWRQDDAEVAAKTKG
jgi:rhodanese-related sulfurtransferase